MSLDRPPAGPQLTYVVLALSSNLSPRAEGRRSPMATDGRRSGGETPPLRLRPQAVSECLLRKNCAGRDDLESRVATSRRTPERASGSYDTLECCDLSQLWIRLRPKAALGASVRTSASAARIFPGEPTDGVAIQRMKNSVSFPYPLYSHAIRWLPSLVLAAAPCRVRDQRMEVV